MDDVTGVLRLRRRAMLLARVLPGSRGLWLIGVALFAAGLVPPIPTRPLVAYVHGVSGLVVILASPVVFWLVSRRLASRHLRWATALAWVGLLSFLGSTVVFAGRAAADPAMRVDPAISITNRLMIATYCLWFVVAAWGAARRAAGEDAGATAA